MLRGKGIEEIKEELRTRLDFYRRFPDVLTEDEREWAEMEEEAYNLLEENQREVLFERVVPEIKRLRTVVVYRFMDSREKEDKYTRIALAIMSAGKEVLWKRMGSEVKKWEEVKRILQSFTTPVEIDGEMFFLLNERKLGIGYRESTSIALNISYENKIGIYAFVDNKLIMLDDTTGSLTGYSPETYRKFLLHIYRKYERIVKVLSDVIRAGRGYSIRYESFRDGIIFGTKRDGYELSFKVLISDDYIEIRHVDLDINLDNERINTYPSPILSLVQKKLASKGLYTKHPSSSEGALLLPISEDAYLVMSKFIEVLEDIAYNHLRWFRDIWSAPTREFVLKDNGIFIGNLKLVDASELESLPPSDRRDLCYALTFEEEKVRVEGTPRWLVDLAPFNKDLLRYLYPSLDEHRKRYILFLYSQNKNPKYVINQLPILDKLKFLKMIEGNPMFVTLYHHVASSLYGSFLGTPIENVYLYYIDPDNPTGSKLFVYLNSYDKYGIGEMVFLSKDYNGVRNLTREGMKKKLILNVETTKILNKLKKVKVSPLLVGYIIPPDSPLLKRRKEKVRGGRNANRVFT